MCGSSLTLEAGTGYEIGSDNHTELYAVAQFPNGEIPGRGMARRSHASAQARGASRCFP